MHAVKLESFIYLVDYFSIIQVKESNKAYFYYMCMNDDLKWKPFLCQLLNLVCFVHEYRKCSFNGN